MKVKRKDLSKKLLSYSALAGGAAMILNPTGLNSLLRHVDPVDFVVAKDTLSIDLSGDGTKDFIFKHSTSTTTSIYTTTTTFTTVSTTTTTTTTTTTSTTFTTTSTYDGRPHQNPHYNPIQNFNTHQNPVFNFQYNTHQYTKTYTNYYCSMNMKAGGKGVRLDNSAGIVEKLYSGAPINNSLSLSTNNAAFKKLCYYYSVPYFASSYDPQGWTNSAGFIGVKFNIGADTHFGWIRVSVDSDMDQITVHDWGYNDNPNGSINAGDFDSGGIWTGAVDSNWNETGNWDDGIIPTSTSDVIIPDVSGDSGNFPILSGNGSCQNITIENGASVTINSSQVLSISGNIVLNNGSGLTNNGDLKFVGNDCYLSDNRTSKTSVGNVIVE